MKVFGKMLKVLSYRKVVDIRLFTIFCDHWRFWVWHFTYKKSDLFQPILKMMISIGIICSQIFDIFQLQGPVR